MFQFLQEEDDLTLHLCYAMRIVITRKKHWINSWLPCEKTQKKIQKHFLDVLLSTHLEMKEQISHDGELLNEIDHIHTQMQ